MTWVDEIVGHMKQINKIRAEMDDYFSPAELIYRPVGMRREHFRLKIARLTRLETQVENKLEFRLFRYKDKKNATKADS